jgi:hypothetical protein
MDDEPPPRYRGSSNPSRAQSRVSGPFAAGQRWAAARRLLHVGRADVRPPWPRSSGECRDEAVPRNVRRKRGTAGRGRPVRAGQGDLTTPAREVYARRSAYGSSNWEQEEVSALRPGERLVFHSHCAWPPRPRGVRLSGAPARRSQGSVPYLETTQPAERAVGTRGLPSRRPEWHRSPAPRSPPRSPISGPAAHRPAPFREKQQSP